MDKICCIFNFGPHYREAIYKLMDSELGCDFYIGDRTASQIKKMNYNELAGFKAKLKYKKLKFSTFWKLGGASKAIFNSKYRKYIAIGDSSCTSVWLLMLWARLTGKRVVLWGHGWHRKNNWKGNLSDCIFWRLPHHIMLYSEYSKAFMKEKGIPEKKMSCICNSLDSDKQLAIRKTLKETDIYKSHFGNDNPVILYIGRLQKRKKIGMILDAMDLLNRRNITTNFVCIGGDDEGVEIMKLAEKYGLENNIWLYGALYDENIKGKMIYNADVCVSPGNVGLTVIDSLTYGLPIITNDDFDTQMPEFEAITDGKTGSFFKDGDVKSLAQKIEEWISRRKEISREDVAKQCHRIIDSRYNIHYQINVIKKALDIIV